HAGARASQRAAARIAGSTRRRDPESCQAGRSGGVPGRGIDHQLGQCAAGGAGISRAAEEAQMMPAKRPPAAQLRLIERLPPVRGRLTEDAPLAQLTWFRVGGPAEVMFRPADVEDLAQFLARKPADVKVTVIGVASNLLIRDGGVKGVVVRLGRGFVEIKSRDEEITAGAGALDLNVALSACAAGIAGLEFLSGIPGTVG